jgi:hypothetical protein
MKPKGEGGFGSEKVEIRRRPTFAVKRREEALSRGQSGANAWREVMADVLTRVQTMLRKTMSQGRLTSGRYSGYPKR